MKLNMYAIYDEKAECYNAPFPLATDGLAVRAFDAAAKDCSTNLYKYPNDYKLYCIGSFDDVDGVLSASIPARYLATNTATMTGSMEKQIEEIEKDIKESEQK